MYFLFRFRNHQVYVEGRELGCTKKHRSNTTDLLVAKKTFFAIFKSLTGNEYSHLSYLEAKSKAVKYQEKWQQAKKFIGIWTQKDPNLLRFL